MTCIASGCAVQPFLLNVALYPLTEPARGSMGMPNRLTNCSSIIEVEAPVSRNEGYQVSPTRTRTEDLEGSTTEGDNVRSLTVGGGTGSTLMALVSRSSSESESERCAAS